MFILKNLVTISLLTGLLLIAGCNQDTEQTANSNSENVEREKNQSEQDNNQSNADQKQERENDTSNTSESNKNEEQNSHSEDRNSKKNDQSEQASDTLNKEQAKVVLSDYEEAFKNVINNTNQELKQQEYTDQQQVKKYFQNFMSEDLALSLMDTFIRKEEDGLYIVATEGPLFLEEDQPFTFTKSDQETATVTQERENPMIGHIQMEYTITKNEDSWIVQEIDSEQL